MRPFAKITAAATTGPGSGPRPASSHAADAEARDRQMSCEQALSFVDEAGGIAPRKLEAAQSCSPSRGGRRNLLMASGVRAPG